MGGARTAPSGRGRDRRAEPGRAGKGRALQGLRSGWAAGPRPPVPQGRPPDTPSWRAQSRRGPPSPQRALSSPARFPGPERAGSARATSGAEQLVGRCSGPARGLDQQWPSLAETAAPGTCPVGVSASAEGAAAAMPFLHGFRRIIFEYQPLVDAILGSLGIQDPERQEPLDGPSYVASEESRILVLTELLERKAHSPFYQEGVSNALLKMAELGLTRAADVLLRNGANLNFEDPVTYYTALHIAVLRNQPDMVELLVRHGADINRRDRIHESSPLDLASEEPERLPCLQRLLDLGADVNAADKHGKTALLHALASSDGVQIHNTENIRLLLEGGADVKATTKDGDTVFTCIIFLLGETVGGDKEEAQLINRFCFQVTQLLLAHGADPSECPAHESLTHICLKSFKLHFPLLRFLLESGAAYNCSLHGASCWSGFHIIFERLCSHPGCAEDESHVDLLRKAETVLDLMVTNSHKLQLPENFDIHPVGSLADKIQALHFSLRQLESYPPPLKHLCRVYIRLYLQPWPVDAKVKALPLPDRLKWYLLSEHSGTVEDDI
ncbi:ankyrin repeat and SOCS box protein 6 [Balaenoptera musculus]|uniref:Ankyrin repeat and SOCS box protein 6 n=8 Tax=Cetacea TaxID=9721 RepID=A0A8B8XS32_BALMU|nr:ankyrin repeat and SOCS box protein 6 [Balaenoptera musculus]